VKIEHRNKPDVTAYPDLIFRGGSTGLIRIDDERCEATNQLRAQLSGIIHDWHSSNRQRAFEKIGEVSGPANEGNCENNREWVLHAIVRSIGSGGLGWGQHVPWKLKVVQKVLNGESANRCQ
jgi:hypothetical protein